MEKLSESTKERLNEKMGEKMDEKLKLRCPSCAKLYEVDSADIQTSHPQFHCVSCESRFTFSFPPLDPKNIICTPVDAEGHSSLEWAMKNSKSCPKCGALSPRTAEECYACHVIFSKLEGLPMDPSLRAQPSLVRKWKLLIEDFANETKHEDFINSCQALEALGFALTKYQDIKQAQGGDTLCDRMIENINARISNALTLSSVPKKNPAALLKPRWQKYALWAPYILSFLLILWGTFSLGHRNLIGLGVATACLATGLITMIKGQLRLQDFFD
jgi:hypothetical protein